MSASSRRAVVMLGIAAVCAVSEARAQQAPPAGAPPAGAPAQGAPAPAPAQQPAQPEDGLKFNADAALIIWSVKPEGAAGFEKAMGVLRTRLVASDNPELKAVGDSLRVYKQAAAAEAGKPVTYFSHVYPASKTVSYNPSFLMFSAKKADGMPFFERAEADELYKLLIDAVAGVNALPLVVLQ
jgi:hypothetical protein